jgi:hypothetical protein
MRTTLLITWLILFLLAASLAAQSTALLTGIVVDPSGAVVPGAQVGGAADTDDSTLPGQQDNTGLAVNGLRPVDNNWRLDGASYTDRSYGSAPMLPNPDTLQEFTAPRSSNPTDWGLVGIRTSARPSRFLTCD